MAVCHILKSGTSKNIQIMTLVRLLFYYCAQYNCVCSAEYISTHDNTLADSLSRLQLSKFRTLAPGANTTRESEMANTSPATCQCLATFTSLKSKMLIFFRDVISLLARVFILLIYTATQEVPMKNI